MTRKKDGSKNTAGRGSRFSLRNILSSNLLAGAASNVNLPIPTQGTKAKDPYSHKSKRNGNDLDGSISTDNMVTVGPSEASNSVVIDCYLEPELLPNGKYICPLCYAEVDSFPEVLSCTTHRACTECWNAYLKIQITESRVNVTCFQCSKPLHPYDLKQLVDSDVMCKFEDFMLRRALTMEPDTRWCPAPDCGFALIASGCASCPRLLCERPGCNTAFCYHCKELWHPNLTCNDARSLRSTEHVESLLNATGISKLISENQAGVREEIKPCPRCAVLIVKMDDGSCNHMQCPICSVEFCWLCMKHVSDLHYLSPSGCTFWGKKPWGKKKKLLWQVGTLIGAPVGIGLVAGIAVPAMIIGIPVWVGRKIHNKMKNSLPYRRRLAMTGGIVLSVVVSPVLAGLAVGLGVPILLAYVYGVVPISLCRSGGCGLTASSSGVKIDIDEDSESIIEPSSIITHHRQSTRSNDVGSTRGAPSIGEVSVVSSTATAGNKRSASPDCESASMVALAGASINGSVGSSHPYRLEIQADVITNNKRHSLSSETASVCLSMNDDAGASTRGLAGSVLSYKVNVDDSKSETSCQ